MFFQSTVFEIPLACVKQRNLVSDNASLPCNNMFSRPDAEVYTWSGEADFEHNSTTSAPRKSLQRKRLEVSLPSPHIGQRSFKRSELIWSQCFSFVESNVSHKPVVICILLTPKHQQQENRPEINFLRLPVPPIDRVNAAFQGLISSARDTSIVSTASEHPRALPKRGSASCMMCGFAFTRKQISLDLNPTVRRVMATIKLIF